MVAKLFSTHWKGSSQPRKQRKYRHNAPLHIRQNFMHVHLSPELRTKYRTRAIQVKKGDKVKLLRGKFKKQEGKVDHLHLQYNRVFVTGVDYIKKDGTKVLVPLAPSNLMITVLDLSDKRRKEKLENHANTISGALSSTSTMAVNDKKTISSEQKQKQKQEQKHEQKGKIQ